MVSSDINIPRDRVSSDIPIIQVGTIRGIVFSIYRSIRSDYDFLNISLIVCLHINVDWVNYSANEKLESGI